MQMELIDALKSMGDEYAQPWRGTDKGIEEGWKIPEIGPAFEGKPFAVINEATGEPMLAYEKRWIVPDRIARRLENTFGKTPKIGSLHTKKYIGTDINVDKVISAVTFLPKRFKLLYSFFQDIDFLGRLGFGAFSAGADALARGQLKDVGKHLWTFPKGIALTLGARLPYQTIPAGTRLGAKKILTGPARRKALRDSVFLDTKPILKGRTGVNFREIMLSGLNLRDRTIFPADLDNLVRDIATESGAMKIKSVARAIGDFEEAFRTGLFQGTYPQVIKLDVENNIAPLMARLYPDLTDAQLNARIAKAANEKYSTVTEGMSAIQNRVLREGLIRVFFSIGEQEGLLKQLTGTIVGPNKRFWQRHWLGGYLYLIAIANLIHYASTGEALPKERYVPISKDSWGSLPFGYNTRFAAPTLPGGGEYGTSAVVDTVNQMDTGFRLLDPQSYITSRLSVPISTIENQIKGANFYDQPIDTVGPGGVVSRTAQLILDLFSPIGPGGLVERGIRETVPAAEDIIPKDPSGLSWGGEFFEAGGLNLRVSLRKELLNQAGQAQFQKSYEELNQLELSKIKEDPELKKKLISLDSEATERGNVFAEYRFSKYDIRSEKEEEKKALVNAFVKDLFSNNHDLKETRKKLTDLSDSISDLSTLEYGRLKELRIQLAKREPKLTGWTGDPPTNDFDKMLNEWYALYDDPKYRKKGKVAGKEKVTAILDWDKLRPAQDKFTEKLPPVLASQLQEWRDRNDIPGLDDLRGLLGPKKRDGTPWEKATDGKKYYYDNFKILPWQPQTNSP